MGEFRKEIHEDLQPKKKGRTNKDELRMNDPAFLFYVNDWAGGTQWLSRLQRGGYLDLLLYQVDNTSFSYDIAKTVLGTDFNEIWPIIKAKFKEENGLFFNEKMRKVLNDRHQYTESRRANRLGKKNKKTHDKHMKKTRKSYVEHMGNGDINENEDEIKKGNAKGKKIEGTAEQLRQNLELPWSGEKFDAAWTGWKQYKKSEHGFKYKSELSETAALKELSEFSEGNEEKAIQIIQTSIANGWKGFFKIKNGIKQNGSIGKIDRAAFERRFGPIRETSAEEAG